MLGANELLIGDHNAHLFQHQVVNGEVKGKGAIPRDFSKYPKEMFDSPSDITPYNRADIPAMLAEMKAKGMLLSQLRGTMPSLDQDGVGYCWAHSTTTATMLSRIVQHLKYVPLSAFSIAATIKKGADEGGWCGLSAQFATDKGIMPQSVWPQQDRDYRKYDTPANWAEAAKHKIDEQFVDLSKDVYDRALTFDQLIYCLVNGFPCPVDFNWWSHSVCGMDIIDGTGERATCRAESGKIATLPEFEEMWGMNHPVTGGLGLRILNSWGDSWSDQGSGVLTGSKAIPDSALCIRTTTASAT